MLMRQRGREAFCFFLFQPILGGSHAISKLWLLLPSRDMPVTHWFNKKKKKEKSKNVEASPVSAKLQNSYLRFKKKKISRN